MKKTAKASPPKAPEPPSFTEELGERYTEFKAALSDTDFYLELILIGFCLSMALLSAALLKRIIRRKMDLTNGAKNITQLIMRTSLTLLTPFFAIIGMTMAKGISLAAIDSSLLSTAAIKLTYVWLLISIVTMFIRSRTIAVLVGSALFILAVLSLLDVLEPLGTSMDSLALEFGKFRLSILMLIKGAVILSLLFWIARTITRTMDHYLSRSHRLDASSKDIIIKLLDIFVYLIAFIITLSAIGVDLTAFAVLGGALGVGIGFGLQKITSNFISGLILLFERSVKVGDLINVAGEKGWVRRLSIRHTLIETPDGRDIMIPNEELIASKVVNWTYSSRKARVEVPITVAYGTNPELVRTLVIEAARKHPRCSQEQAPDCFLTSFGDNGLGFLFIFWVDDITEGLMLPQHDIMSYILEAFAAHNIVLPFPQRELRVLNPHPAKQEPK